MFEKLASLSKLKFDETEKLQIKNDLQNMIGLIKKMDDLDTSNVEPLLHMTANVNMWREDVITGSITNTVAMQNATNKNAPFFIVPKVIIK